MEIIKTENAWKAFDSIDENTLDDQYEKDGFAEDCFKNFSIKTRENPSSILKRHLESLDDSAR
jgi:hypothetical protein